MSMPSASYSVQMGVMADSASEVSRQLRPAMEPLSSMRKTVSNCARNAYGESALFELAGFEVWTLWAGTAAGAMVGGGVLEYAGGGSCAAGLLVGVVLIGPMLRPERLLTRASESGFVDDRESDESFFELSLLSVSLRGILAVELE